MVLCVAATILMSSQKVILLFPASWYSQEEVVAFRGGYALLTYVVLGIFCGISMMFSLAQFSIEFTPKNCKE